MLSETYCSVKVQGHHVYHRVRRASKFGVYESICVQTNQTIIFIAELALAQELLVDSAIKEIFVAIRAFTFVCCTVS